MVSDGATKLIDPPSYTGPTEFPSEFPSEVPRGSLRDEADVEEPATISCVQWSKFAVVWTACCCAAGIVPGQALFTTLLADAGSPA